MTLEYHRVEQALTHIKRAIAACDEIDPQVQTYLTGQLLSMIHADFERHVREVLTDRVTRGADSVSETFIKSIVSLTTRSIRVSELSGYAGRCGDACKQDFKERVSDRMKVAFDNIETNRQAVAHGSGPQATITEVEDWFREAKKVIAAFREAIDDA